MKFYCINTKHKYFFAFLIALFFCFDVNAQTSTSSPYSRFGIGIMEPQSLGSNTAMGGCYTAYMNDTLVPLFINPGNPASYSTNRITTFELGARTNSTNFISDEGKIRKNNSGFNYISLAVPIKRNMGLAAGLVPFSNVGYNASSAGNVDSIGQVNYNYQGSGGINKAFLGFAIRPFDKMLRRYLNTYQYKSLSDSGYAIKYYTYKKDSISITKDDIDEMLKKPNADLITKIEGSDSSTVITNYYKVYENDTILIATTNKKPNANAIVRRNKFWRSALSSISLGGNADFLYGTIDYYSYAYFPYGYGSVFNTKQITETSIHDVYYQGGAQMAFDISHLGKRPLKKNIKIILGYSISIPKNMTAKISQVAYSFSSQSDGTEQPFDTAYNKLATKGVIFIPLMQSIGLGFKRGDNLTVLLDAGYQQWSKYKSIILNDNQNMRNSYTAAIGLQFLPHRTAIGRLSYLKRINYRLGARYNSGNLVFNNKAISTYAFSAGVGLPSGGGRFKLFTMINISAEYGINGTTSNNLVQERYIRFVLGLTFNDRWFIKSKYD